MSREVKRCKKFFKEGKVVDHYAVNHLIGCGGYGCVFSVTDQTDPSVHYAMKVEYLFAPAKSLLNEINVLKQLSGKSPYFPTYIDSGLIDDYRYLVMELFGPSVSTLRKQSDGKRFPFRTALGIAGEMLKAIEALHELNVVHCDIKPSNFLIDERAEHPLKLIDFGLAEEYVDRGSKKIRPEKFNNGFRGTMRYASMHSHEGVLLSPRDDLMSWFYSLVELAEGELPWYGREGNEEVLSLKRKTRWWQLCRQSRFYMVRLYAYIRGLGYAKKPDYQFMFRMLESAMKGQSGEELTAALF